MAYNILGITPGHNGSVALISDGELILYLEEERLSRIKYDSNPLRSLTYIFKKYKIDELVITGVKKENYYKNSYLKLAQKYNPSVKYTPFYKTHHLAHASNAFFNSGFSNATSLVIDTAGSVYYHNGIECEETESIFIFEYPHNVTTLYKSYTNHSNYTYTDSHLDIYPYANLCKTYESVTQYLGFGPLDSGKTMGLSSYGKLDSSIPPLIKDNKGNPNVFTSIYGIGAVINSKYNFTNRENLAYHVQKEAENSLKELVQKTINMSYSTNIVCSGGFFLNCVANYYLIKHFSHINFYFEPTSHDGGNSVGAALYRWYEHSGDTTIRPRKTLYNGPKYTQEELLEGIKKYVG